MMKLKTKIEESHLPFNRLMILAIQHLFAMFGATVLVPSLTGLNPAVALFSSGVGTLIFHFITKGQVPAYLGSSFAFIGPIIAAKESYGLPAALLGCFVAGLIYVSAAVVIKKIGTDFIDDYLPPVVVGPVIVTIGLGLAPTAKSMAMKHLPTAIFTLIVTIMVSVLGRGIVKVIPILIGIISGYLFALVNGIVDTSALTEASWFAIPDFTSIFALSSLGDGISAITLIAPIAIVTMVEHLGDVLALSNTVDEEFIDEPGLHRTLLGDGVATAFASMLGGPPNTTYGENIGVLALTGVHNPIIVELAALIVLGISFIEKIGALIQTIPQAVMGGIVILLFGMISSIGLRTLIENDVDLSVNRNLVIVSTILVVGISGIPLTIDFVQIIDLLQLNKIEIIGKAAKAIDILKFKGMGLAAMVGIVLNMLLPKQK
ncbi:uracil-xanthine permease [Halobacteroides halobius DSM 5150]|uniref:Uracil-xanthine permease n=1 Tax=Halobacteroides halobius (strain ATCC 35273 / DSM 5150 / MD-1) TaxID=748449 RepID=L0K6J3_HALHC|nr:solute carrier family 23 protein [Halobacteroides halobius]AGB40872.1 uracil-xanthine permease [Halobacteroides halobius DSM 5150]